MELLNKLGVDWRLLLAQLFNFVILLALLYKFLYKPVLKLLQERSAKIEQSLKNADAVEVKLREASASYEKKVLEARGEAQKIIEQAKSEAEAARLELSRKAQEEAEKIVQNGHSRLTADKEKMLKEAAGELADLVASATEHVLGNVITPEINQKLIDEAVRKVKVGRA
ncbi:MAG: ATP synthase subunit b [Parcubacteria group bacterium GW2011_GWC2_45_7]|nr:MAG: ATP synthase subunit b [Parcubacteria group bacterium GW2011_GWC2_45_7]KKU73722.1 MAG: ATP synthase subunit b [Parcubacteria group bacterium GW2011_GWA2_47_26]